MMKQISSLSKRLAGAKTESGQAIILIALFMVVMLTMVGVAIDGGGVFLLWRDAQNAADTAALQAAFDRCTGASDSDWQAIGYAAASVNGFDNADDNTVVITSYTQDGTEYTKVTIEAQKPTYFIQLVYNAPLQVTTESLVFCSRAVDFTDLPGVIALGNCVSFTTNEGSEGSESSNEGSQSEGSGDNEGSQSGDSESSSDNEGSQSGDSESSGDNEGSQSGDSESSSSNEISINGCSISQSESSESSSSEGSQSESSSSEGSQSESSSSEGSQ
ncbi:MAG: Tad domain-containing protein, partial [Anaerolineae bacterium]|nr:Tad domain-containing protein [Anaerolineae bacterium]